ncbi:MAG: ATP-binding protein [Thermodesulfobacteriota bacterium]|nr:ATP-binding protein [Thermodesulfobacteriota bacterium]
MEPTKLAMAARRSQDLKSNNKIQAFPPIEQKGGVAGPLGVGEKTLAKKESRARLGQAQKMETIGTLAGGIAHDFNNLLSIILGNAELAMDDVPEQNPAQESLKELRDACLRAKDLVSQILSFGRQAGQELKPVKMTPLLEEALKLLRASIPTTIDIHRDVSCESDTVLADPTQIVQVLLNLCANAAHAMAKEGGRLEVSLRNMALGIQRWDLQGDEKASAIGFLESPCGYSNLTPGNYVRLTVTDNGCGIDPALMGRIFDPYFTTKGVGEGTGLGLSVVLDIVKSYGGAITVDSDPAKGTTFDVFLPTSKIRAQDEPRRLEAPPGGGERILLIDDERALIRTEKQVLERLGYAVVATTGSLEALDVFRAQPDGFDLVITDMTMPGITGDRFASELMAIRPDIPVILCTGYGVRINEEQMKAMGIRALVMKPVDKRELAGTIRSVLKP